MIKRTALALSAASTALFLALPGAAAGAPCAAEPFGLCEVDVAFTDKPSDQAVEEEPTALGPIVNEAGIHPYAMTTSFEVNGKDPGGGGYFPLEAVRDALFRQVEGFAGAPDAVPTCDAADFLTLSDEEIGEYPECPDSSAVGVVANQLANANVIATGYSPLYNIEPPPGAAAKLGFWFAEVPVTIEARLAEEPPYRVLAAATNISQLAEVVGSQLTLWGVPADPDHDHIRGRCMGAVGESLGKCEVGKSIPEIPFLTTPRACESPLETSWSARSWLGSTDSGSVLTHDEAGNPEGMSGCGALGFAPRIAAAPTSKAAQSPTGLDFTLQAPDEGIMNPNDGATAASDIAKTVVTLPRGMTINPAQAEGLEVCGEARLAEERSDSTPGEGCPQGSKIGTIEAETPLLDEVFKGSLYVAEPYDNLAGDSLIAVYAVIRNRERGILVTQPIRVEPDPVTGQLVGIAEDIPQLPISEFRLHFREGSRSPLVTPPGCGSFAVKAKIYPHSGTAPVESVSPFEIVSGPDNGPCPSGPAPFRPGFSAGTLNNAAGAYSPFLMRLTREDGEQDMTKFSAVLPPGVLGRIAGVPRCPEAGIARARSRTGKEGGREELGDPSCPAASAIGRTTAGAGVGSQLTYVPGSLYLAGPYNGAPLSVVSITPALAGPFDAGTVTVRVALDLNPKTGVVEADGAASDPIPHILQGIPLNVRDLRVYVDRPGFTLNATSCDRSFAFSTLWGGGTALEPRGEVPVGLAAPYQAASCASLGFKPKLGIKLRGGTRRGGHPALRAVVTPRPGDANFARAAVTLPRSAFLDQAHIRTVCTRVQFAAGAGHGASCPPGARYGFARAWSPLLAEPLEGPVFLRSSDNKLPDLAIALRGLVEIELSARIDSIRGGIRSTFEGIPDAPVSRFVLDMQGGRKGLIVNSRNLCRKPKRNRARSNIRGQNGRLSQTKPAVRAVGCRRGRSKSK